MAAKKPKKAPKTGAKKKRRSDAPWAGRLTPPMTMGPKVLKDQKADTLRRRSVIRPIIARTAAARAEIDAFTKGVDMRAYKHLKVMTIAKNKVVPAVVDPDSDLESRTIKKSSYVAVQRLEPPPIAPPVPWIGLNLDGNIIGKRRRRDRRVNDADRIRNSAPTA